jgi:hypothetical protein
MMRCEEALHLWQQELLGEPVDRDQLEKAFQHIGACEHLCAQTLGIAPAFAELSHVDSLPRRADLYEALGLRAEEEGDAYARDWRRLQRKALADKVSQATLDHKRALALAAWQAAAAHYRDGLRIADTAFLREGLKRLQTKQLRSLLPRTVAPVGAGAATAPVAKASKRGTASPPSATQPAPTFPQHTIPQLVLASAPHDPGEITVKKSPVGWQTSAASGARLPPGKKPTGVQPDAESAQGPEPADTPDQPHAAGLLGDFALALWATQAAQGWKLEMLVRAHSSSRPWTKLALTLEDAQGQSKPTDVLFARRAPHMTGWWARLRELDSGHYHLRLSAHDARGEPIEEMRLSVHLVSES